MAVAEPPRPGATNSGPEQLALFRNYLAEGSFESVIQPAVQVINRNDATSPADVALYALGEVYANHAYPGRDYARSKDYFVRLIANFPDSPLSSEARTFVSLYDNFAEKEKKIASLEKEQKERAVARETFGGGNFEAALKDNLQSLKAAGPRPPADHALYNLGLIYAHIDNPGKDFHKAQRYFSELIREFPASPLAEEARVWLGLFEVLAKMQQIDLDIEQQKKLLNR